MPSKKYVLNSFKVGSRLCLLAAALLFVAGSVNAQSVSGVAGRWVWKEVARKNKPQTKFTVVIHRDGARVRGVYSVDQFVNGVWQGEDGNQTPFRGRVTGTTMEIEFDETATVPGYEQNVVYKAPRYGLKPSIAVLTLNRGLIVWRLVSGAPIENVPAKLVLKRESPR